MKRLSIILALLPILGSGLFSLKMQAAIQKDAVVGDDSWNLIDVVEVAGRQGIAVDEGYYYVSGSTALYKYRKDGTLVLENTHPFDGLDLPANHIGDIDVYNGEIYAGIETFVDGVGTNIQVAVYDASTLKWKRSISWNPDSGQVEVCGLAVDAPHGRVWMADWVQGTHLYCYNLSDGSYVGKVALSPVPRLQQGILYSDGKMFISCDDGDAEKNEYDNLYVCDIYSSVDESKLPETVEVKHYKYMNDFRRPGEIEGLSIDPVTGELVVLANRGARIILGMPKGFYPGYDREIHELYIFSKERSCGKYCR